jgi:hypothetical protein
MKGAQPIFREEWRELTMICSIFPSLLFSSLSLPLSPLQRTGERGGSAGRDGDFRVWKGGVRVLKRAGTVAQACLTLTLSITC